MEQSFDKIKPLSVKARVKQYMLLTTSWTSTRELRTMFGEAADRRLRELRKEGMDLECMRSRQGKGYTFFWRAK